jgi:surface polysaccharide O-acyltransferase-like enzyme
MFFISNTILHVYIIRVWILEHVVLHISNSTHPYMMYNTLSFLTSRTNLFFSPKKKTPKQRLDAYR